MPFVRFSRDKRGYEHVYLVEASRGRGAQAHVLYWFRTPPGIKVGREPFDEGVRRALEAQNPNLVFDWKQIASTPKPPPDVEHWRERRKAERAAKKASRIDDVDEADDVKDVQDALPAAPGEAEESLAGIDEVAEARGADDDMASGEQAVVEVAATPSALGAPVMSDPLAQPGGQRRRRRRGGRRRRRGPGVVVPGMPGTASALSMDPPPAPAGAGQDPGPVVSDPGGPAGPGGYGE